MGKEQNRPQRSRPPFKGVLKHIIGGRSCAALLTTVALMFLVRIPNRDQELPKRITAVEQNGIYDLTGIEHLDSTAVTLPPGAGFIPTPI